MLVKNNIKVITKLAINQLERRLAMALANQVWAR